MRMLFASAKVMPDANNIPSRIAKERTFVFRQNFTLLRVTWFALRGKIKEDDEKSDGKEEVTRVSSFRRICFALRSKYN